MLKGLELAPEFVTLAAQEAREMVPLGQVMELDSEVGSMRQWGLM